MLLDAPQEAAKTAEVLLSHHKSRANRTDTIPVLKLLAFAASREELPGDLVAVYESLYDGLWGRYTPPNEIQERHAIDALLNPSASLPDARHETK